MTGIYTTTVYQEMFVLVNFHEFLSLAKILIHEKIIRSARAHLHMHILQTPKIECFAEFLQHKLSRYMVQYTYYVWVSQ